MLILSLTLGEYSMNFLNQRQLAERLNIAARTIERWRCEGKGPRYHKFGSRCLYSLNDILLWEENQVCNNISQQNSLL